MRDETCVFCKIVAGEIPAEKIYEDDTVLAFLDINPVNPGHALVIPKNHVDRLYDVPDEEFIAVTKTAKKLAKRIQEQMLPKRVGWMVHGFDIPHAHIHLIPMKDAHDLGVSHKSSAAPSELQQIADTLRD